MSTKLQLIQAILGEDDDDKWGTKSQHALDLEIAASRSRRTTEIPVNITTLGDGTWPWTARIDGEDVVVDNCRMTCFGGSSDPQDSGETASGVSTKKDPMIIACSLPMDGRMFPGLSRAEHSALDGSPIPRVPWNTIVEVHVNGTTLTLPVIDLGPGKRTGNALDLTIGAARLVKHFASATNFEANGSYRVIGAAKYAKRSNSV